MRESLTNYLKRMTIYFIAIILSTWVLLPIFLITLAAFSVPSDYYNVHKIVPTSFTFKHVHDLFFTLGAWKATFNSIMVALITIGISFGLGIPAGYSLSRFAFKGRESLKLAVLFIRMFPIMVIGVPLTVFYLNIGLADTLLGVALAHTAMVLPFVILITSSIFSGIPVEYEEAAMIFGLSRTGAFFRTTLPLALPGIAAAAMFAFIMSWNEVFVAAILTLTNRTLPAHILTTALASIDPIKFAAGFIMLLPALIFILLTRKYLMTVWGITLR